MINIWAQIVAYVYYYYNQVDNYSQTVHKILQKKYP